MIMISREVANKWKLQKKQKLTLYLILCKNIVVKNIVMNMAMAKMKMVRMVVMHKKVSAISS